MNGCDDLLVGSLSGFAGALSWEEAPDAVPAADLAEAKRFDALIERFLRTCACDDRPAAISFWSQFYFSRLTIAGAALTLAHGQALPLALDAVRVSFCPETGRALRFCLGASTRTPPEPLFAPLIDGHLAPLIAILKGHSGLSARLLWENAGRYLLWGLCEMRRLRPACRPLIRQVLADLANTPGRRHPLDGMIQAARLGVPVRHRVCCLRHRIPGFAPCDGVCPLA